MMSLLDKINLFNKICCTVSIAIVQLILISNTCKKIIDRQLKMVKYGRFYLMCY